MALPGLDELVKEATRSELFTSPRLEHDLAHFLDEQGSGRGPWRPAPAAPVEHRVLRRQRRLLGEHVLGEVPLRSLHDADEHVVYSYELSWRAPRRLGPGSLVFLASYSGKTEDTLAALRFAKAAGAHTVGLVKDAASPIGEEADEAIAYGATALYALPMAAVTLFALEWARLEGDRGARPLMQELEKVPAIIGAAYCDDRARCERLAREFLPADTLYCVGAGPLYGLAYKFALTVFMENIRTHGSIVESAEFRHGPAEMLDRQRADMVFLLGTDESRGLTQRSLDFARERGARTIVFDAADYEGLHPLLAPFVLKVPLQWFVVYSALMRGIIDLDERVFMGRRVLSDGQAGWP